MEKQVTVGPYGGQGGNAWDDGVHSTVRQLVIYSGWTVDSIQIEYDQDGQSIWSPKYGGDKGDKHVITLDYPAEYLVSITGHYGKYEDHTVVRSLTIQSNKKEYGPYGRQVGDHFSTPPNGGKIMGFYGRSGTYLDSIGAHFGPHLPSIPVEKQLTVGPYGGQGGNSWDDGFHSTVRQLVIYSGWTIDSIQIEYDQDGQSIWSPKHGGDKGDKHAIVLDYPAEYLVSISGHYGKYEDHIVVRSLTIQSNKKQYGPYGRENGDYFSTPPNSGKIIGFHGRSGTYLDSIGAHFCPHMQAIPVGAFGGLGGNKWDDRIYTTVRQLIVCCGTLIDSINIEYDDNGQSKWSQKHGDSEGGTSHIIKLDYPNEFLISMSGYLSEDSNNAVVQSLTFQSNKREFGPYGVEGGKYFSTSQVNGGKIVGFFGRSGLYVDAIGAYLGPFPVGPFGGHGGNDWDDGTYSTVRQLIIYSGILIDSIQIEYDKNGSSEWSKKHGESDGGDRNNVQLDYPSEYLVSVSGYYGRVSNLNVVRSLTFESNRRTYGPFGVQEGDYFNFPSAGGKIVGFHGRSGVYVDSIGAHIF